MKLKNQIKIQRFRAKIAPIVRNKAIWTATILAFISFIGGVIIQLFGGDFSAINIALIIGCICFGLVFVFEIICNDKINIIVFLIFLIINIVVLICINVNNSKQSNLSIEPQASRLESTPYSSNDSTKQNNSNIIKNDALSLDAILLKFYEDPALLISEESTILASYFEDLFWRMRKT